MRLCDHILTYGVRWGKARLLESSTSKLKTKIGTTTRTIEEAIGCPLLLLFITSWLTSSLSSFSLFEESDETKLDELDVAPSF